MKSIIFWDITSCSPLSVSRRFGGTHRLHLQGRRNKFSEKSASNHLLAFWFLAELISSTLKMEAMCSSETSADTQRPTRRYIPEDNTLLRFSFQYVYMMETKIAMLEDSLSAQDFYYVRLLAQGMTYPQRCFRQAICAI
jgi:hypothetical protein